MSRLLCPWDSPGKDTGVGCHFLLQNTYILNMCNNYVNQGYRTIL